MEYDVQRMNFINAWIFNDFGEKADTVFNNYCPSSDWIEYQFTVSQTDKSPCEIIMFLPTDNTINSFVAKGMPIEEIIKNTYSISVLA